MNHSPTHNLFGRSVSHLSLRQRESHMDSEQA